ncbi:DM DNA binding domain protein [Dictyocaulus viviparus]|uniref:DM DNA binding domain protein n=1 Tax=Dictyocaulus viviparus TaxID=29172 RepID=A0A0D8XZZ0_DICVI|nr:DM DNA binding domain protein [Dictyocaulus viviparus]
MNIEDIVPELFGEKRVYYCQRCLNHGLREKRKNHKQNCVYSACQCSDCLMVERRRELNSRLVQIEGDAGIQNAADAQCSAVVTSGRVKDNKSTKIASYKTLRELSLSEFLFSRGNLNDTDIELHSILNTKILDWLTDNFVPLDFNCIIAFILFSSRAVKTV